MPASFPPRALPSLQRMQVHVYSISRAFYPTSIEIHASVFRLKIIPFLGQRPINFSRFSEYYDRPSVTFGTDLFCSTFKSTYPRSISRLTKWIRVKLTASFLLRWISEFWYISKGITAIIPQRNVLHNVITRGNPGTWHLYIDAQVTYQSRIVDILPSQTLFIGLLIN